MDMANMKEGAVLIPDDLGQPLSGRMGSAIRCMAVDEKGFRFRKMNIFCGGEEFFLAKQALQNSHWTYVPDESQLRFF
jgi:hypothetical protein